MSLTTDATDDQPDDAGADDADDGDQVPERPTDQELADYFQQAAEMDDPPDWVEYFGFEGAATKVRKNLDDRVRDFFIEYVTAAEA